jgi:hypothetical protein
MPTAEHQTIHAYRRSHDPSGNTFLLMVPSIIFVLCLTAYLIFMHTGDVVAAVIQK